MPSSLAELPVELLNQIVCHLETAQNLSRISITCKRLHEYVEENGYRAFVRRRFPSIQTLPYWRDAAHALTTLSKAWDTKAFVAKIIFPEKDVTQLPRRRGRQPPRRWQRGQTMGYQPVMDCYEETTGESWLSRKELLAWGAGAELNLKATSMGEEVRRNWGACNKDERIRKYDLFRHRSEWITYKDDTHQDGRDDITSVRLLRPWQKPRSGSEQLIIGRASGELALVSLSNARLECRILSRYFTADRRVQSAHVSNSSEPLLAACFSDGVVALYSVYPHSMNTKPFSELSISSPSTPGRTWCTSFLRPERLAIGLGPSTSPLHIYDVASAHSSSVPLRKYSVSPKGASGSSTSSVYSIVPLDSSSQAGGSVGDVFMSGWYDGTIKVHDLRAPASHTAIFTDPVDTYSAVYSLLPIGRERFVAGSARHSIVKVFDFRMSGNRLYFATDAEACVPDDHPKPLNQLPKGACCSYHFNSKHVRRGYNVFLDPSSQRRRVESPVYALASAAPYSPRIYAGLEGRVIQLDIVKVMDRFPDAAFQEKNWRGGKSVGVDLKERYDPESRALRLAAVEQLQSGQVKLMVQAEVGEEGAGLHGWDQRWGCGPSKF
ncbi:hypothetical protein MMC13_002892 [Lambiella insularis]|nr:hypothetical protein [Lambiella insularis]